ncbi:hypothetical protein Tco_0841389, partial [Tanacetum coccineum]
CALSLDKLAMPPHLHKKFHMGVAIAKGCRGCYKTRNKGLEYKPTKEEEEISKLKAMCENVIYDISDSDSDLESTARSGPRDSEMEDTGGSEI